MPCKQGLVLSWYRQVVLVEERSLQGDVHSANSLKIKNCSILGFNSIERSIFLLIIEASVLIGSVMLICLSANVP